MYRLAEVKGVGDMDYLGRMIAVSRKIEEAYFIINKFFTKGHTTKSF